MSNDKLEELYYKYHLFVKDVACKVLEDPYLAQDVCHDVFLKLSDEWIEADLSPLVRKEYLRVAAYHKAVDYLNQKWVDRKTMSFEKSFQEKDTAKHSWHSSELEEYVMKKVFVHKMLLDLKKHKEHWYMVVLRKEIYHEPVELIARELNVKGSLVRLWLHRAKMWIKENYYEEYQDLF